MNLSRSLLLHDLPPPSLTKETSTQSTTKMIIAESSMRGYRPTNEDETLIRTRFAIIRAPTSIQSLSHKQEVSSRYSSLIEKEDGLRIKSLSITNRYSTNEKMRKDYSYENLDSNSFSSNSGEVTELCPVSLFCVFDGHGGDAVSRMLKREFANRLLSDIEKINARSDTSHIKYLSRDGSSYSLRDSNSELRYKSESKNSFNSIHRPLSSSLSEYTRERALNSDRVKLRTFGSSGSLVTHRESYSKESLYSNHQTKQVPIQTLTDTMLQQFHLDLDKYILDNISEDAGSCSVSSIIQFLSDGSIEIICMNVGDSRCVVCDNNNVYTLTKDHKPNTPAERLRIEKANHTVFRSRVDGQLAISRAFGNRMYKDNKALPLQKQAVTAFCDIQRLKLPKYERNSKDNHLQRSKLNSNQIGTNFRFMILACDGVWDVMTETEVCSFIRQKFIDYDIFDEMKKQSHSQSQNLLENKVMNTLSTSSSTSLSSTSLNHTHSNVSWFNTPVAQWKSKDIIEWISTLSMSLQAEMKASLHEIASLNGAELIYEIQKEVSYLSALQAKYKLKDPVLDALRELKYRLEETDKKIKNHLALQSQNHSIKEKMNTTHKDKYEKNDKKAIVQKSFQFKNCEAKLARIVEELLDECVVKRMSTDNVSVCIVLLKDSSST